MELERYPQACVIRSPINLGLGAALNALVLRAYEAGHRQLVLFDQDTGPQPAYPELLAAAAPQLVECHRLAVIGPKLVPPPGAHHLTIRPYSARRGKSVPRNAVEFVATSGSLISIDAWRDVGPFREDYFIDSIDIEWCLRAWHAGYVTVQAKNIELVHRWGTESETRMPVRSQLLLQSPARNYYYFRNKLHLLGLPHTPSAFRFRELSKLMAQGLLLLIHSPKGAWQILPRALSDGLRGKLGPSSPALGAD